MNITDVFVNTLYEMANGPIPAEAFFEARKCVLDLLGSMIGGTVELKDRLGPYLDLMSEREGSTVVGFGREASLQNAVLVNGMCAHVFDMDDGHRFSTVHLAATIVPAVLTVCERFDRDTEDLLRGVIIGYEAAIRLGRCLQPSHRDRGFHASGTIGTVGAAMGIAAALGFTRLEMKSALSAATSSAAGNNRMSLDSSTLKPYNIGRAGHDGVTAALLAKAGFIGPDDSLGGNFGWLSEMAETFDVSGLDLANDANFNILGAYHKPYASCRHTHAPIDGALSLRAEEKIDPQQVRKIVVRMYRQGVKGHDYTDIPTVTAGKMSIQFCVALALVKGAAGMHEFNEENIRDPEILRLTELTEVIADEALTKLVPKKRAASVEIILKNGTHFFKQVDFAKGEPEIPMTLEDFRVKFSDLAGYGGKTEEESEAISRFILESNGKIRELMGLLK